MDSTDPVYPAPPAQSEPDPSSIAYARITLASSIVGPVKVLGYFAALDFLPTRFLIEQRRDSWYVQLEAPSGPRTDRILNKVSVLPTVIDCKISR
ncbi:MAG: hypothetical protein AAGK17_13590 [Pseudomonadota bacterium]